MARFGNYSSRVLTIVIIALVACMSGCDSKSSPAPTTQEIDPKLVRQGPIQHQTLPDELMTRIKKIQSAFAEVDDMPLEKWVDDFKRDLDPEGNVRIWEDMQVAYEAYCSQRDLPLETKQEVFRVVLMRSMVPDKEVLKRLELKHLTREEAESILASYPGAPKPIEVIKE